jgi:hypothetical protein
LNGAGTDVEDSLYWIAYATQPSNIGNKAVADAAVVSPYTDTAYPQSNPANPTGTGTVAGSGTPDDAIDPNDKDAAAKKAAAAAMEQARARNKQHNEELMRRIALEALGLANRVPRVKRQCEHEEQRISRLAAVMQVGTHDDTLYACVVHSLCI